MTSILALSSNETSDMKKKFTALISLLFLGTISLFVLAMFGYYNLQIIGYIATGVSPLIESPAAGYFLTVALDIIAIGVVIVSSFTSSVVNFKENLNTVRSWLPTKDQKNKDSNHPTTF